MAEISHEDTPALVQDLALRVAQSFAVHWLQGEVAGDPLFVQCPEGSRVLSRLEWSYFYLRMIGRMPLAAHLQPIVMHFARPLTEVCPRASITSNILFCCIKIGRIWIGISSCGTCVTSSRLLRSCTLATLRSASISPNHRSPNKYASLRNCWDTHSSPAPPVLSASPLRAR